MERYGEFLFEAESANIKECLINLTEDNIESCCEYKIFNRGHNYYQDGLVEQIRFNIKANTISAEVNGSKEYDIELYIEDGEVNGSCNCEYCDVCKHIIAVLLNIADNGIENISTSDLIQQSTINSLDF